ncbi:MAG: hypothetical protein ABIO67_01510 [Mycobacteriales bacterium]
MRINKKAAALAVAAVTVASVGTAYAYWTTSGSGTGSASTGTSQAVAVSQVGTTTGLVLNGTPSPVGINLNNPAAFPQYVTTVTMSISSVVSSAGTGPACSSADFALVQPTWTAGEIATGNTAVGGATIGLVNNAAANQDRCKGATVNLAFSAS